MSYSYLNNYHFIEKNNKTITFMSMDDYISFLYSRCEKTIPTNKRVEKISNDNITTPTIDNLDILFENNYNVQQLKQFTKQYKLKVSGNKKELVNRIYVFLRLSKVIIKIQKVFRGFLLRKCNSLHGPALMNRKLCTNDTDFLSGDDFKTLNFYQFFSYKDEDEFIYGFDIISLYNLIIKSGKNIKNPYNRMNISKSVVQNIRNLIRISRVLKIPINIDIKENLNISNEKSIELRALDLFQNIDALGNYSDPAWFLTLYNIQINKFIRE